MANTDVELLEAEPFLEEAQSSSKRIKVVGPGLALVAVLGCATFASFHVQQSPNGNTVSSPSLKRNGVISFSSSLCGSGVSAGRLCCPKSCGTCGGKDCQKREGGSKCCGGFIKKSGKTCESPGDVACVMPPKAAPATDEAPPAPPKAAPATDKDGAPPAPLATDGSKKEMPAKDETPPADEGAAAPQIVVDEPAPPAPPATDGSKEGMPATEDGAPPAPPATDDSKEEVNCGAHSAPSCQQCPQGHDAAWCHGDCKWAGGQCMAAERPVNCGAHSALSCQQCPQGHGAAWCHGDCKWAGGQCE